MDKITVNSWKNQEVIKMYGDRYDMNEKARIRPAGLVTRVRTSTEEYRGMLSVLKKNLGMVLKIRLPVDMSAEEKKKAWDQAAAERMTDIRYILRGLDTYLNAIEYSASQERYFYWETIHNDLKELRRITGPKKGEDPKVFFMSFSVLLQAATIGMQNALQDFTRVGPVSVGEATPSVREKETAVRRQKQKPMEVYGEDIVIPLFEEPKPTPPPSYYENPYHMSGGRCRTCGRYGCEGGAACEIAAERRADVYQNNPRHASGAWYPERGSQQAKEYMQRLRSLRSGERRPLTRARMGLTRTFGRDMEQNPRSVKCPLCGEITTIPIRPRGTQYCKVCNGSFGATEADPRRKKRRY